MSEKNLLSERMRSVALAFILAFTGGLFLTACENEGPAEEAGESIDEAAEEAGDSMEEAGDEAGDAAEEAADEAEEATD